MTQKLPRNARDVPGTQVTIKRVPELVPEEVAKESGMKLNQRAPVAKPEELEDYDAVIFGTPTRFGNELEFNRRRSSYTACGDHRRLRLRVDSQSSVFRLSSPDF